MRWFVRAPIWLFRARLGFLLGSRLLMLEHLGRKSGGRRHVVLEVVTRAPGSYRPHSVNVQPQEGWARARR